MNIGILGAGRMGQTLARLLVDAGHRVRLANSRGPESLRPLIAELGPGAVAGTSEEIVAFADVVVLATRWEQTPAAVKGLGPWNGEVVIDTTNNRTGPRPEDLIDLGGRTSSEVVADLLPGARVVKAFNHQPISALAESLGARPASATRCSSPATTLSTSSPGLSATSAASPSILGAYAMVDACKAQAAPSLVTAVCSPWGKHAP